MKATNLKEAMRAMGNPIMMMETRSLMKSTNLKEAMRAMGNPIMMMETRSLMKSTNLKEAMRAMGNPIMMMETRSLMKAANLKKAMRAMGNPIMMMTAPMMMGKPIITMVVMRETAAKMDTTGRRKRKDGGRTALGADVAAVAIATTALAAERVTMKETGKVVTIMENMATSMDMVAGVAVDMAMAMAMVMDEGDTKRKLDEQPPTRKDEKNYKGGTLQSIFF